MLAFGALKSTVAEEVRPGVGKILQAHAREMHMEKHKWTIFAAFVAAVLGSAYHGTEALQIFGPLGEQNDSAVAVVFGLLGGALYTLIQNRWLLLLIAALAFLLAWLAQGGATEIALVGITIGLAAFAASFVRFVDKKI